MKAALWQVEEKSVAPEPTEDHPDIWITVQQLTKNLAISAAVLYAIGMLITNEYLFSLGITDFNLIRPKCIITGTWAVVLMLACCGPALSLDRLKDGKITKRQLVKELFAGYIVAIGLGLMFCSVLVTHWSLALAKGLLLVPLSLAFAPLLYFLIWLTLYRGKRPEPSYTRHTATLATMVISPVIATVLIAVFIYPEVHPALGGGRPQQAKLVLSTDGLVVWRQISGTSFNWQESVTTDLEILCENESQIVVRLRNPGAEAGSVAVIDKKLVLAILPKSPLGW